MNNWAPCYVVRIVPSVSFFLFFFLMSLGGAEQLIFDVFFQRNKFWATYSRGFAKTFVMQYFAGVLIRYLACGGLLGKDMGVLFK